MGKKTKETETETDTETNNDDNTIDTDTDSEKSKKDKTLLDKFNRLSKKTKLYLGIFIVLLLAGLFMWYKNRKTMSGQTGQIIQLGQSGQDIQIQQIVPNTNVVIPPVVQATQVAQPIQIANNVSPQNGFN